jgi:hypothetical protein
MLDREIIAVCSEIHTKNINTLCGQNVGFVNVKPGGTYSNHWVLKGQRSTYIQKKWFSYIVVLVFWRPSKASLQSSQAAAIKPVCSGPRWSQSDLKSFYTVSSLAQKEMTSNCRLREFKRVQLLSLAHGVCFADNAQRTLASRTITKGVKSKSKDCHWKVFPSFDIPLFSVGIPFCSSRSVPTLKIEKAGESLARGTSTRVELLSPPERFRTLSGAALALRTTGEKVTFGTGSVETIRDLCHASSDEISCDLLGQIIHVRLGQRSTSLRCRSLYTLQLSLCIQ